MSEPPQRAKRVAHYKQPFDWLLLFQQLQSGHHSTQLAAEHPGVNASTLRRRYNAWCAAKQAGDAFAVSKWEGKVDGRRYSHSALSAADEAEVASRIRAAKQDGECVGRRQLVQAVMELWSERTPHITRAHPPFKCSPQFVTRFRRRHGFSTTVHTLRRQGPAQRQSDDAKIDDKAEGKENADTLSRAAARMNEAYEEMPKDHIVRAWEKAVPTLPPDSAES